MGKNKRNEGVQRRTSPRNTTDTPHSESKSNKIRSFVSPEENGFHFEDLFNTMNLGVIYHDRRGRIIKANPAAELILGIPMEKFVGRSVEYEQLKILNENSELISVSELPFSISLRTGKRVRENVIGFHNPAMNMIRWMNISSIPLFKGDEKTPYMVCSTFDDITELTLSMKSLAASEEKYRTLVNSIQELVFVFSEDGKYIQHYGSDESLLVCPPESFIGLHISEVLPEETSNLFLQNMIKIKESHESITFDYPLEIRGNQKWFSATMSLHDNEASYVAVVRELTEKIRNEQKLKQQHEELEIFASLLRHDLGNDVHAILNQIEWAELTQSAGTSEFTESMESVKAIVFRMVNLLNSVGRPTEELDETLGDMLYRIASSSQKAHPGVTVHINVSDNETRDFPVVALRLLPTVLDNLIRNSAEHSGRDVEVSIMAWIEENNLYLEVKDDGPGIAEAIIPSLFAKGTSTGHGGLGLYLSRRIMQAYSGSITLLESGPCEGACFLLELPKNHVSSI